MKVLALVFGLVVAFPASAAPGDIIFEDEALLERAEACLVPTPDYVGQPFNVYCNSRIALRLEGGTGRIFGDPIDFARITVAIYSHLAAFGFKPDGPPMTYSAHPGLRIFSFVR